MDEINWKHKAEVIIEFMILFPIRNYSEIAWNKFEWIYIYLTVGDGRQATHNTSEAYIWKY